MPLAMEHLSKVNYIFTIKSVGKTQALPKNQLYDDAIKSLKQCAQQAQSGGFGLMS